MIEYWKGRCDVFFFQAEDGIRVVKEFRGLEVGKKDQAYIMFVVSDAS